MEVKVQIFKLSDQSLTLVDSKLFISSDLFGSCGGSVINSKYTNALIAIIYCAKMYFFRWIITAYHCVALDRVNFEVESIISSVRKYFYINTGSCSSG